MRLWLLTPCFDKWLVFIDSTINHPQLWIFSERGMGLVSEVLYSLLLDQFMIEIDENTRNQVVQQVKGISQLISETNSQSTNTEWERLTTKIKSLGFDEFNENSKKKSEKFLFWRNFISKVFLTRSGAFSQRRWLETTSFGNTGSLTIGFCIW